MQTGPGSIAIAGMCDTALDALWAQTVQFELRFRPDGSMVLAQHVPCDVGCDCCCDPF